MPIRKSRLSKYEEVEYRTHLSRLGNIGVVIGSSGDLVSEPERFTLEQIDHEFARVHDLAAGEVAVVLPAKLTVRQAGVMITEAHLIPSWFDWKVDLDNVENNESINKEITQGLPFFPPRILNHEFVGRAVPLRPCQIEGVILGNGFSPIPPTFHDETPVTLDLLLLDERGNGFSWEFKARVDRSVIHKRDYLLARNSTPRSTRRSGLYDKIEPDIEIGVSRERQKAMGGTQLRKPL